MINDLIKSVEKSLPLKIERAEWNDPVLSIGGSGWSFNTTSSWRIVNQSCLVTGCEDDAASEAAAKLKGCIIRSCEAMSVEPALDPRFILSNGTKLEVFSATAVEPWVMRLPGDEPIFVASPTDDFS